MKTSFTILLLLVGLNCFGQLFQTVNKFKHDHALTLLTVSREQKIVIAGDEKGYLHFHQLETGYLIKSLKVHERAVAGIRFNSTGKLLISYTSDGEIKIFDFEKDKVIQSIYSPDYEGINFVLFSIADGFIYFNCKNKLYKTRSDLTQSVSLIREETDTIADGIITTDRSALIYAFGNKLRVINTRTDMDKQELSTGSAAILHMALVGDTLLTTWSLDGTISYWHYLLGQLETTPSLSFKAGNPSPLAFSSDGYFMASGRIGNWARVWRPQDRTVFQELFAHTNTVTCAAFGANDRSLFTCGLDGYLIKWEKSEKTKNTNLTPEAVLPVTPKQEEEKPATVTTPPVAEKTKVDSTPNTDVKMTEQNNPSSIKGRKVVRAKDLEVHNSKLKIFVFDNSFIDGDTMSLFFNGTLILNNYGVMKKKKEIILQLIPNTNNYLVLFANNLGKNPPNTAAVEIIDGNNKKIFRISSDMQSCSAINFIYKP